MQRNQPFVPRFQLQNMSGYSEQDMEMSEPQRHTFNDYEYERPSMSIFENRRSRSLNLVDLQERPNLVISGHRKLRRNFYTGPRSNFENHASKIVAKLEQDEVLMKDTPISEQLRKEALRDLPQCLTMKRCVKEKLSKSVSLKSKRRPIGFWKRFKYRSSISFSNFVHKLKNFNYFELWHDTLKDVEGRFGSGYASYFKFVRWLFVMNLIVAIISSSMIVVPQIIYDISVTDGSSYSFTFADIFTGNGFFNQTVFYYGHYINTSIEVIPYLVYNMPAAYFATIVFLYLMSFVVLAVSVAESYRRTFIETEGGLQNVYANRVFCGWDYGIATQEAAQLKSSAIYNELKELLSEELEEYEDRTCLYNFWTYTIQIVVNILVLVLMAAVGWATWLLLEYSRKNSADNTVILTAIIVNIIMLFFPSIFRSISEYEDYKNPRTAIYITLTRTYLLGAVLIGVIVSFWLIRAHETDCWENHLGSEIYRLILFDFLFSIVFTAFIDVGYFIGRYFRGWDPKSEFNIARHTLQIVYNQGLFWVGFIYSPVLPLLVTLKMFVIWYIRVGCVRKLCKPPRRTWRAAQAQTWFMMMTFVSILVTIAMHGYTLKSIDTSACGPFSNYSHVYEIVTDGVARIEDNSTFWQVVLNVTKPGGIALILIALVVLVYYVREQAKANEEKVKRLRDMVVWMAKDKKFLVQWYNNVTKGQIDTNYFHDLRLIDPSKVLPNEYSEPSSIEEGELNARFKKFF